MTAAALATTTAAALAIPESARTLAESSISASTRRAYAGALARLDSFTAGRQLRCKPRRLRRRARVVCGRGRNPTLRPQG